MSLALLITRQQTLIYPTIDPTVGAVVPTNFEIVELDASITEEHISSSVVIRHPIEDGSTISDHVSIEPDKVVIEGQISNYPPYFGVGILYSYVRAEKAYDNLREFLESATKVDIITTLRDYKNMILTNLTVPRTAETGNVLRFTATFESIKIVKSMLQTDQPEPSYSDIDVIPTKLIGNLAKAEAAAVVGGVVAAGILAFGIARSV